MIGIGITTKNRRETLETTLGMFGLYAPTDCVFVIVDDGSDEPLETPHWTGYKIHRFNQSVGIARAKNKCLELLYDAGVEHFFLFDDDTYPKTEDWWEPYVQSHEPHLMYIFQDFATRPRLNDTTKLYENSQIVASSHARGCMLYFKRICLDTVGGMDPIFGKWGYEHPELSNRIFNAGLTTFRYMDVPNSHELIYSSDEYEAVVTTTSGVDRRVCIQRNEPLYQQFYHRKDYVDFREKTGTDVVITTFIGGVPDPQRPGTTWEFDPTMLEALVKSCFENGATLYILTDCISELPKEWQSFVHLSQVEKATLSPYWYRWMIIRDFLRLNTTTINRLFCVDATDVEMLKNPFAEELEYNLYFGDEDGTMTNCQWMKHHHPAQFLQTFFHLHRRTTLLNAGILGGHREVVLMFLDKLLDGYFKNVEDVKKGQTITVGEIDMGLFNYVARTFFPYFIVHGQKVNTKFKANEYNDISWFKHK